jgi:hypothetical protein
VPCSMDPELRVLFHRLNNQLGIILAHAELLEAKAADDANRARAAQVVRSVLDAMGTTREIRPVPGASFHQPEVRNETPCVSSSSESAHGRSKCGKPVRFADRVRKL